MNVRFYEQHSFTLVGDLEVSDLTFKVKESQFLMRAGSILTPIEVIALPIEFMVSKSGMRLFFKSRRDAEDFISKVREALGRVESRNNTMLD